MNPEPMSGYGIFMLRQARLDTRPASLELAIAGRWPGRPLLHFTLNEFVIGLGLKGKKIFKFIQKQRYILNQIEDIPQSLSYLSEKK
jgi:hypothetical protein